MRTNPTARQSDLVVQATGGETLVYNLKTNQAYCLNETSAAVWNLCDGSRSISEISAELSKHMDALIDEDFVMLALDQLKNDRLLDGDIEPTERFAGLSRREIVKKVGFASAVALPIVSSLVAPKASSAQSGLSLFSPCVISPTGNQFTCNGGALICTPTVTYIPVTGGPILGVTQPTFMDQCCTHLGGFSFGNIVGGTGCVFAPCSGLLKCDGTPCVEAAVPNPNCTGGSNTCIC